MQHRAKKPCRVLVVDDDIDNARMLRWLLHESGHEVEYAINGIAAVATANRFRPQVVLLDLKLPDGHGADVARQLRANPELRTVRIVAITASKQQFDHARAVAAGCDETLVKPVHVSQIEALIEREMGG